MERALFRVKWRVLGARNSDSKSPRLQVSKTPSHQDRNPPDTRLDEYTGQLTWRTLGLQHCTEASQPGGPQVGRRIFIIPQIEFTSIGVLAAW